MLSMVMVMVMVMVMDMVGPGLRPRRQFRLYVAARGTSCLEGPGRGDDGRAIRPNFPDPALGRMLRSMIGGPNGVRHLE
jgi:hypothetical protein